MQIWFITTNWVLLFNQLLLSDYAVQFKVPVNTETDHKQLPLNDPTKRKFAKEKIMCWDQTPKLKTFALPVKIKENVSIQILWKSALLSRSAFTCVLLYINWRNTIIVVKMTTYWAFSMSNIYTIAVLTGLKILNELFHLILNKCYWNTAYIQKNTWKKWRGHDFSVAPLKQLNALFQSLTPLL